MKNFIQLLAFLGTLLSRPALFILDLYAIIFICDFTGYCKSGLIVHAVNPIWDWLLFLTIIISYTLAILYGIKQAIKAAKEAGEEYIGTFDDEDSENSLPRFENPPAPPSRF